MDKSEKTLENIGYLRLLYQTVIYKPGTAIDENQAETYICTNLATKFKECRDTWILRRVGDFVKVYNKDLEVIESYKATEKTVYELNILYDETLDNDTDLRNKSILAEIRTGKDFPQKSIGITDFSGHVYKDIVVDSEDGVVDGLLISYLHPGWHNMLQLSSTIITDGNESQHCRIVQLNPYNSTTVYYDNMIDSIPDDVLEYEAFEFTGHTIVNKIGESYLSWKSTFRTIETFLIWVDDCHTMMDIIQFDGHYKKYIGHCSICMNSDENDDESGNISSIEDVITILNPIAISVDESIKLNYKNHTGYIDYARSMIRFNNNEIISALSTMNEHTWYLSGILLYHFYGDPTEFYNDDHDLIKINLRDSNGNSAELNDINKILNDIISTHKTYKIGDVLFSLTNESLIVFKVSKRIKSKYIPDTEVISELDLIYYYRYRYDGYENQTLKYAEASDKKRIYYVILNKTNDNKNTDEAEQIKQIIIDPSSENEEGIIKVRDVNVVRDKNSTNDKMIRLKPVADLENKGGQIESAKSNEKMLRLACRYLFGPSVFIDCYI